MDFSAVGLACTEGGTLVPTRSLLLVSGARTDRSRVRLRIPGAGNRKTPFQFWESCARIEAEWWWGGGAEPPPPQLESTTIASAARASSREDV